MPQLAITIDNKTYRMNCGPGEEEHLLSLAVELDRTISGLRSDIGEVGDHRLSIMAGLLVLDEMQDLKKRAEDNEEQIRQLTAERDEARQRADQAGAMIAGDLGACAEQIEKLARRLNGQR